MKRGDKGEEEEWERKVGKGMSEYRGFEGGGYSRDKKNEINFLVSQETASTTRTTRTRTRTTTTTTA